MDSKISQDIIFYNDNARIDFVTKVQMYERQQLEKSFVSFDNDEIEFDALKKSECGNYIVLRFHDYACSQQKVKVNVGFEYSSWVIGDLRERPISQFNTGEINLDLGAYEIQTILFKL